MISIAPLRQLLYILFKSATILLIVSISSSNMMAQDDFWRLYKKNKYDTDSLDLASKIARHEDFLLNAQTNQDTQNIIFGHLYLNYDHHLESNYTKAMNHIVQAIHYASEMKDTFLLGVLNHKRGTIYSHLKNYNESIKYYEISLAQSSIAKDSAYIAITLEQLARKYTEIKNFEKSNAYYQQALPLVEKHSSLKSLAVSLTNYANSLDDQDSTLKAIQLYKKAIAVGEQLQDDYEIYGTKSNLAYTYNKIDSLDKALELYQECKKVYEKNGWLDYLAFTYEGLSSTFEKKGKIDSAYHYFLKYYELKDSIIGVDVQVKIKELEEAVKLQQKNNEILSQKESIVRNHKNFKNAVTISIILLILCASLIWYYYQNTIKSKRLLKEKRKSLKRLATQLAKKSVEMKNLSSQINKNIEGHQNLDNGSAIDGLNYFELTILTEKDWHSFKALFEQSFPGYLKRIRTNYPDISPAEERLFIFIKLKISNSESANILGVQTETIKKTRSRLRKRLHLSKEKNLNDFISKF